MLGSTSHKGNWWYVSQRDPLLGVVNRKQMCNVRDFRWTFGPFPHVMDIIVRK